ncbi:hypothetical protein C8R43DRAFT_1022215 [Mycena crocata]|nr:hypothetical protein C8R43DRAFT_1022215 [Mycena crocata]
MLDTYKYPVLTLPNEITSEIFINFLPPYPVRPPIIGPLSPSFLCRICRRWRDVALATPWLWSSMQLDLDENALHQQQLSVLETWLKRSGSCSLSISLRREDDVPEISTSAFLDAVVHHAARWESMELILPYTELRSIRGYMPALRALSFGPTNTSGGEESLYLAAPFVVFDHAPNLESVELYVSFNPLAIHLPWASITTLVASLYAEETVGILRDALALVRCTITLYPSADPATFTMLPPLPHLKSLILEEPVDYWGLGTRNIINLLSALTLPALQTLEMDETVLGCPDIEVTIPALISFISRIRGLQKLQIMRAFRPPTFYHERLGDSVPHLYVNRDSSALDG